MVKCESENKSAIWYDRWSASFLRKRFSCFTRFCFIRMEATRGTFASDVCQAGKYHRAFVICFVIFFFFAKSKISVLLPFSILHLYFFILYGQNGTLKNVISNNIFVIWTKKHNFIWLKPHLIISCSATIWRPVFFLSLVRNAKKINKFKWAHTREWRETKAIFWLRYVANFLLYAMR